MYIKVTVLAGSKKEYIKKKTETSLEIAVKAKALQNMANRSVIQKLSEFFDIPTSKIRLINGHHSPKKMFNIDNEAVT